MHADQTRRHKKPFHQVHEYKDVKEEDANRILNAMVLAMNKATNTIGKYISSNLLRDN
jgi:hypothetical protein